MPLSRKKQFRELKVKAKDLRKAMQNYTSNPMDKVLDGKNMEKVRQASVLLIKIETLFNARSRN